METLSHLFENNRAWSEGIRQVKPEFFLELSRQQSPKYLWIECSDSRVPANQMVGLAPGELFVHRNLADRLFRNPPRWIRDVRKRVPLGEKMLCLWRGLTNLSRL